MGARENAEHAGRPWLPLPGMPSTEQAQMFGSIAMSLPAGIVAADLDARIVWANPAAESMFGRRRGELPGLRIDELLSPEPGCDVELRNRLLVGEHTPPVLATGLRQTGETFDLSATAGARRDGDGRLLGTTIVLYDVTEELRLQRELQSRSDFFRALNQQAPDATMVVADDGKLVYATPSLEHLLGCRPGDLVDVLGEELAHPQDMHRLQGTRRRLQVPGARERFDVRLRSADGDWHWFQATVTNLLDDPRINGAVVNLRDTAAETAAEQALRESEARYRAIAQTAQEGILAVSPDGVILFANERLTEILDITLEQVDELARRGVFSPPGTEAAERFDVDYEDPRGDTRILSVATTELSTDDGRPLGSLAMVSDVTEQRSSEARLRHQALHDPLTGLPNRMLFSDRLATAEARQERSPAGGIAVLFLDLDDFKQVNDTHGHQVGDRMLVQVADRVAESVRATDTVARLGGDEFAVICEDCDTPTAVQVAGRIRQALETPVEVDQRRFAVRASIGIALTPPHSVSDLLRLADRAMYQAKRAPHRGVVVYDEGDHRSP
jgi:diguanylate cyclase (GGDEF)-like protein/PAS domain S-box-containing protein